MKRSTGRVPMAQPPGSDTRASPMRASSGPITQKLARMLRDELVGRDGVDDLAGATARASRRSCRSGRRACPAPCSRRRDCRGCASACATSARRGTLSRVSVSSVSRLAIISGSAAFLAPEIGDGAVEPLAADDADAVHAVAPAITPGGPYVPPVAAVYMRIGAAARKAGGGIRACGGTVVPDGRRGQNRHRRGRKPWPSDA